MVFCGMYSRVNVFQISKQMLPSFRLHKIFANFNAPLLSEMELPEINGIFRRKKKAAAIVAIGSKTNHQITQPVASLSLGLQRKFIEVLTYHHL